MAIHMNDIMGSRRGDSHLICEPMCLFAAARLRRSVAAQPVSPPHAPPQHAASRRIVRVPRIRWHTADAVTHAGACLATTCLATTCLATTCLATTYLHLVTT